MYGLIIDVASFVPSVSSSFDIVHSSVYSVPCLVLVLLPCLESLLTRCSSIQICSFKLLYHFFHLMAFILQGRLSRFGGLIGIVSVPGVFRL